MKGAPITRAQASSVFMRSDSVQSVQSVESNCSSLVCEHCRCDDCILGITDHHVAIADLADLAADFEGKMRLQSQFLSSVKTQAGAAAAAADDDGDGLGIGGGDVRGEIRDSGNFRRKVRGQMISKIYTPISILLVKSMYTTTYCIMINLWSPLAGIITFSLSNFGPEPEVKVRFSRNLWRLFKFSSVVEEARGAVFETRTPLKFIKTF